MDPDTRTDPLWKFHKDVLDTYGNLCTAKVRVADKLHLAQMQLSAPDEAEHEENHQDVAITIRPLSTNACNSGQGFAGDDCAAMMPADNSMIKPYEDPCGDLPDPIPSIGGQAERPAIDTTAMDTCPGLQSYPLSPPITTSSPKTEDCLRWRLATAEAQLLRAKAENAVKDMQIASLRASATVRATPGSALALGDEGINPSRLTSPRRSLTVRPLTLDADGRVTMPPPVPAPPPQRQHAVRDAVIGRLWLGEAPVAEAPDLAPTERSEQNCTRGPSSPGHSGIGEAEVAAGPVPPQQRTPSTQDSTEHAGSAGTASTLKAEPNLTEGKKMSDLEDLFVKATRERARAADCVQEHLKQLEEAVKEARKAGHASRSGTPATVRGNRTPCTAGTWTPTVPKDGWQHAGCRSPPNLGCRSSGALTARTSQQWVRNSPRGLARTRSVATLQPSDSATPGCVTRAVSVGALRHDGPQVPTCRAVPSSSRACSASPQPPSRAAVSCSASPQPLSRATVPVPVVAVPEDRKQGCGAVLTCTPEVRPMSYSVRVRPAPATTAAAHGGGSYSVRHPGPSPLWAQTPPSSAMRGTHCSTGTSFAGNVSALPMQCLSPAVPASAGYTPRAGPVSAKLRTPSPASIRVAPATALPSSRSQVVLSGSWVAHRKAWPQCQNMH